MELEVRLSTEESGEEAKENSWPQFDAVTILCANVGIHGISVVLLR